jgi:hypothetical protein
MAKAKVIIKKLNAPHQNTSLKNYLPLNEKMVSEIRRAVGEIFDELGGSALLKSSGDVYIKPNAIDAKAYCHTRIEVLKAVIEYWQQAGAKKVYVLENSTQANYTRVVFAVNGYAKLCRQTRKKHGHSSFPAALPQGRTITGATTLRPARFPSPWRKNSSMAEAKTFT